MFTFELVFDHDWAFTNPKLSVENQTSFISKDGTFLSPKVQDESNNWGNRGSLLRSYRDLVEAMKEREIYSEIGEG